jgi:hypothetical protein
VRVGPLRHAADAIARVSPKAAAIDLFIFSTLFVMQFPNQWGSTAAGKKLHSTDIFCIVPETAHNLLVGHE